MGESSEASGQIWSGDNADVIQQKPLAARHPADGSRYQLTIVWILVSTVVVAALQINDAGVLFCPCPCQRLAALGVRRGDERRHVRTNPIAPINLVVNGEVFHSCRDGM